MTCQTITAQLALPGFATRPALGAAGTTRSPRDKTIPAALAGNWLRHRALAFKKACGHLYRKIDGNGNGTLRSSVVVYPEELRSRPSAPPPQNGRDHHGSSASDAQLRCSGLGGVVAEGALKGRGVWLPMGGHFRTRNEPPLRNRAKRKVKYRPEWVLIFPAMAPLIAAVGGCTFSLHDSLFAAPGKFNSLECAAIADNIKTGTAREQQLDELIKLDTADGGSTGTKAFLYQDDLNAVREDIWGLRQASDAKDCPSVMAPAQ